MKIKQFQNYLKDVVLLEVVEASKAGQSEYTLRDDALDNFNRLAENLGMDRKHVLWIYLQKHLDGIVRYIRGHKSQREHVNGRITDAMVYLSLLRAMIAEDEA